MRVLALYLASLKVALRSIVILLVAMLALVTLVLVSLPPGLFSANDIPKISLALVYGDGTHEDMLVRNLNAELENIEVVDKLTFSTASEAAEQLAQGEIDAIITLPDDTLDVLVYGGHATITVEATDPLIGSVVYSVASRAVEALDTIQNYALIFEEASRGRFSTTEERYEAVNAFNLVLLGEAFKRMSSVDTPYPVSPYYTQVLTLLLFFVVSIGGFFVAVIAARHYACGYVRHLYTRGVRFWHLLVAQLALAATIAFVLGCVLALILSLVGEGVQVFSLILSAVLLSLLLTVVYLLFSGFRGQSQMATTRTLIGSMALMFFLLFAGGGFYPTGLMAFDLRLFNPTWLSNQLAVWSLGGSLDPLQMALFILPFGLACLGGYFEWRRSL